MQDVTVWPTAELGEVADWELRFKHAATCNFIGNLVFRIAHNFVSTHEPDQAKPQLGAD